MKLRKITEVDKMYRCCRWCHYYQEGKCWRKGVSFSDLESSLLNAADMGEFSEVIEETMMYPNDPICKVLQGLKSLLSDWKISSKRIEKFQEVFIEEYEMCGCSGNCVCYNFPRAQSRGYGNHLNYQLHEFMSFQSFLFPKRKKC